MHTKIYPDSLDDPDLTRMLRRIQLDDNPDDEPHTPTVSSQNLTPERQASSNVDTPVRVKSKRSELRTNTKVDAAIKTNIVQGPRRQGSDSAHDTGTTLPIN
jgi:hypothetical protein